MNESTKNANCVRQFSEQIIKLEKCTYVSIARRKLGTDRAKRRSHRFGCSPTPPKTGRCAHSRGKSSAKTWCNDRAVRTGCIVARTFVGVVRPSERDVQRLRVLGLMLLPAQKPEPISKILHESTVDHRHVCCGVTWQISCGRMNTRYQVRLGRAVFEHVHASQPRDDPRDDNQSPQNAFHNHVSSPLFRVWSNDQNIDPLRWPVSVAEMMTGSLHSTSLTT
jgi:hypothetical protein